MARKPNLENVKRQAEALGLALVPFEPTNAQMDAGLYQASHDAEYGDVWQSYVDMVKVAHHQGVS